MKGTASLTSCSVCLSSVQRKATEFCVLILNPAILLKAFISCRIFLLEF